MQINRLFEIVYLLMNKKTITAKELASHFEVSQRTIYRDIETLCEAGIPIYTNKGKGGGICLMDHFVLNKSVLSEQEQHVILSALKGMQATTFSETDQILSKLSSLFGNENPDWIEVDFSNWNTHDEGKMKFSILKEAILSRKIIQFKYYNSYGQESHRWVEPQKLIFKGQAWYLNGYCRDKKDQRFFKISRMKNLKLEEETFQPKLSSMIPSAPAPAYHQTMIPSVLKIDAEMAYRIYDEFPVDDITKNDDGSFLLHTNLISGGWLYGYLMSYEDHLEILEPDDLRDKIQKKYKTALDKYKI